MPLGKAVTTAGQMAIAKSLDGASARQFMHNIWREQGIEFEPNDGEAVKPLLMVSFVGGTVCVWQGVTYSAEALRAHPSAPRDFALRMTKGKFGEVAAATVFRMSGAPIPLVYHHVYPDSKP